MSTEKNSNIIGDDEYLLSNVPEVPLWNETFACLIGDPVSGLSSNFYIGSWWGRPDTLRQMIHIQLPGDRALFAKNYELRPRGGYPSAAGLSMEPIGQGQIRYSYDGPMDLRKTSEVSQNGVGSGPTVRAKFDFIFSSKLPIWDLHATDPHSDDKDVMFPGGHMEQLGKMSGSLEFDGESVTVDGGPTIRDHSRGVRDFSKHHSHIWVNAQFPSGWGFYTFIAKVPGESAEAVNAAALIRDGNVIPATLETDGMLMPGSDIWAPFDLILRPTGLEPVRIRASRLWNCFQIGMFEPADVFWGVPSGAHDHRAMWALEQSCEFESNQEAGIGHVERCNRDIVVDDKWRSMCTPEKIAR